MKLMKDANEIGAFVHEEYKRRGMTRSRLKLCEKIGFCLQGVPVRVRNLSDGTVKEGALELFEYLNEVG